jgi:signal transduction histidine kinase/ligand-binding sensor domain-containing protein
MIRTQRLLLFFCLQLLCCFSTAQSLITSYSVEEGLPQSTVMALYRDNSGFLWCGTGAGLGLYDGWEFHQPDGKGIASEAVMHEAVRGIVPSEDQKTIWVGTESALLQFDRYSAQVLKSFDVVNTLGSAEVPVFANDTAVWVVCWGNGLFRVRISDGRKFQLTSQSIIHQHGLSDDHRTIIIRDTAQRFVLYDLVSNRTAIIQQPEALRNIQTGTFINIPGKPDELLFTSSHGLWKLNIRTKSIVQFRLGDPDFNDGESSFVGAAVHPDGSWWFSILDQGVYRYDPVSKRIRPCFWQQDGKPANDLMKFSKSIVCDDYGVVWLGTDGAGVVKMLHGRIAFKNKYTASFVTDTCNWFVRSFYEISPERFLVGTFREGIRLIDNKKETITKVSSDSLWSTATPYFIADCGNGYLLSGTEDNVLLIDTASWGTQVVRQYEYRSDQKYTGFLKLRSGKILVYGNYGVFEFTMSPTPALTKLYGEPIHVTDLIQLKNGHILAASYHKGIQEISEDGKFIRNHDYKSWIGLPLTTVIHGMYEDSNGNLWVGSQSGLHKLDRKLRLQQTFNVDKGLPDNTVYDLLPVSDSIISVATGHGLAFFNVFNYSVKSLYGADGLPSEECNTGALLYTPRGTLYIGTTEGFALFNPSELSSGFRSPSILLSYGTGSQSSHGLVQGTISRDYGSGSLDLRLWLTDFAFPQRTLFSYKLEGADQDFIEQKGLRTLNFAALGPGSYSLLCSASNPDGQNTGVLKLIDVVVVPPYWMSTWFTIAAIIASALIISLIAFLFIRMSYKRKLRKLRMQQEIEKMRQRISRDIHDEIGAGLTRIALSGDLIALKQNTDPDVREKLKWISGTARDLSQNMKEVVWSVNPHYDSLDHMVAYFRSLTSDFAERAGFGFVYKGSEDISTIHVNPEVRRNLLLILKETLTNIGKHAEPEIITLGILESEGVLSIVISDDGKGFGFDSGSAPNSNGLRNMKQRAEAIGFSFDVHTSKDGTSITVSGKIY